VSADLSAWVNRIGADRERGASELLAEVIALLRETLRRGVPIRPVADALLEAQPSMASIWTAAAHAVQADGDAERFERFSQQVTNAPRVIARHAANVLLPDGPQALRVVTISFSRSVLVVLDELRKRSTLHVACAEGRPALEGRRLAAALADRNLAVTCYADAALADALELADLVLVGADAMTPEWFLNKSGTRMLAAAAGQAGIPLYVVASRDKFVPAAVAARLQIREGAADEVWGDPPAGVTVRNPYFETTPLDLVSAVISDLGVLGAALVPGACEAASAFSTFNF
jgi:translation initiation factor 2B subunit (eIF-2B alpha/beta/delta family)